MDSAKVAGLISQLSGNVSDLKAAIEPLLNGDLHETASKLPVLDRAKLYSYAAYTIESIIFANLRLQGVDAKDHAVYTELLRVRQYFTKVEVAEKGEQKPNLRVDQAAAGRIIKHDLAANKSKGIKRRFDDNDAEDQISLTRVTPNEIEDAIQETNNSTEERQKSTKKGKKKQKV